MMLAVLLACTSEPVHERAPAVSPLEADLVAQTWQVRMADAATRAPYEAHPGWALLFQRDLEGALHAFGERPDDRGRARVHLELAALYRQAARLAAEATLQVYGADRQATDPADVDYLVGVSETLLGKPTQRLEHTPADSVYATRVTDWRTGGWPATAAVALAAEDPAIHERTLRERTPEAKAVRVVDPTELLAVSLWHENEATRLGAAARWLDPWRLPIEPPSTVERPLADEMLFAGFLPAEADAVFVSAACSGERAPDVYPRSILAQAIEPALVDGRLDVQKVREAAQDLSTAMRSAMIARSGQEEGYQRAFAALGQLSVLRAAVCVAEVLGQPDDAGVLRLEIADLSEGAARDPVFLLSLAAWDAAHRNVVRALDIVHALGRDHPQLELARVPLDAMSVRLSRNSAPAAPVH
jgi:hypothetical protein